MIYLTPEKLASSGVFTDILVSLNQQNRLDRFVIDEAHCVCSWGQDFRKDYMSLGMLKLKYPGVPHLCLTATATQMSRDEIVKQLNLKDVVHFQSSFNRKNLFYELRDKENIADMEQEIATLINMQYKGKSGIIYCISRKECEELSERMNTRFNIKTVFYHGDISKKRRKVI